MAYLSVFIPAYNPGGILEGNVMKVHTRLAELGYDFELFIVDDSSTDSTASTCGRLAQQHKEIKFIRYENGPSRRENLARSFSHASGGIVVFMDVDLSVDLKHLQELVDAVEGGYDIAVGSRHLSGSFVKRRFHRRVISALFMHFIRTYFSSGVRDHQCGFKAFRKNVILKLVEDMGFDHQRRRKFSWDTEMLLRAQICGYRIKEIPVAWAENELSTFSFVKELSCLPYLFDLRFKLGGARRNRESQELKDNG